VWSGHSCPLPLILILILFLILICKGTTSAASESTKSFSATCLAAAEKRNHLNEQKNCHVVLTLYPPNSLQTLQYKGVTSIIYKTKDLAPRSQPWIGLLLTRSRTDAVTIVAHG
jgi:hypothetical protein